MGRPPPPPTPPPTRQVIEDLGIQAVAIAAVISLLSLVVGFHIGAWRG